MKACLLFLFLGAFLAPAHAEYRKFTNTGGKTLDAELVTANDAHVSIRTKGGRIVSIKRDTLSEDDQTYINTWISNKVPDVEVRPNFDRGLTKDRNKYSPATKQTFGMRVEVKNYSPDKTLEESEVIYYLIGRDINDRDRYKVLSKQVFTLTIDPGKTKKAIFKDIVNNYREGTKYQGGKSPGQGHRGIGYVLHIKRKRDNRLVHLSSPTTLLDNVKEKIIALEQDDETDETFVKPKKPEMVEEKKEEKKPDVITIK